MERIFRQDDERTLALPCWNNIERSQRPRKRLSATCRNQLASSGDGIAFVFEAKQTLVVSANHHRAVIAFAIRSPRWISCRPVYLYIFLAGCFAERSPQIHPPSGRVARNERRGPSWLIASHSQEGSGLKYLCFGRSLNLPWPPNLPRHLNLL